MISPASKYIQKAGCCSAGLVRQVGMVMISLRTTALCIAGAFPGTESVFSYAAQPVPLVSDADFICCFRAVPPCQSDGGGPPCIVSEVPPFRRRTPVTFNEMPVEAAQGLITDFLSNF